ncbi:DUF308 domain-containing protein [Paraburkholderia dipogonis]|uniref:DUF308 domain-containing protein n=1 Tax=Paraburkholderia dipogonis TaxID=1211383 RepID=A0ABW9AXY5_9BURK
MLLLVRGIAGLLSGLLALLAPGITHVLLIAMFAAYALLGCAAAVLTGFRHRSSQKDRWFHCRSAYADRDHCSAAVSTPQQSARPAALRLLRQAERAAAPIKATAGQGAPLFIRTHWE